MNGNVIKIIGFAATAIGMGATLVSNWVSEKQIDAKITEKVNEAVANINKIES